MKTISPSTIGRLLEEISWGKASDYHKGGKGFENVLTAEVFQALDFLPRSAFLGSVIQAIEGGSPRESIVQAPAQMCFRINSSPFKDPSGGFVIILEDITEKTTMEEQLLQATKLASVGRLTAGLSHEIGNPLASISSLVQELASLPPEAGRRARRAHAKTPPTPTVWSGRG